MFTPLCRRSRCCCLPHWLRGCQKAGDGNAGGNWGLGGWRWVEDWADNVDPMKAMRTQTDVDADADGDGDASSCTHNFPKILSCPIIYNFLSYFAKFNLQKNRSSEKMSEDVNTSGSLDLYSKQYLSTKCLMWFYNKISFSFSHSPESLRCAGTPAMPPVSPKSRPAHRHPMVPAWCDSAHSSARGQPPP